MSEEKKVQFNVRISAETVKKLDEIVNFYQESTKIGKVYKNDVLTDVIDKAHDAMQKQKLNKRPQYM